VRYEFIEQVGADPGKLARTENGVTVTVCDNVADFVLQYNPDESLVSFMLTVQRENPESRGQFIRAAYTTSVRLRN